MKKDYLMYMHAGSFNHGCEAIIRSLCGILDREVSVLSNRPDEDIASGLNNVCNIIPVRHYENNTALKTLCYLSRHISGKADLQMGYAYKDARPFDRFGMALSVGGDNYCYDDALVNLKGANELFEKNAVPTALVGCSVEPDILELRTVVFDIAKYRCIIARESLSYSALVDALPSDRKKDIYLLPDPAFALEPDVCDLPEGFKAGHTIGINISPMILGYETPAAKGITLNNYRNLIQTVINDTDDMIALIPHVTTEFSNDEKPIQTLYDMFADTGRIIRIHNRPASELKYIISSCRLLIAARTHASIAAYSTFVPTLVVGYSVKAAGIADELFGSHEGYVCPVQSLAADTDLVEAYKWLESHASEQAGILRNRIPEMIKRTGEIADILDGYDVD